jgi:hypothetical protein
MGSVGERLFYLHVAGLLGANIIENTNSRPLLHSNQVTHTINRAIQKFIKSIKIIMAVKIINLTIFPQTNNSMSSQPSLRTMAPSNAKMEATSYSPTTVFAVDDLSSVFRAADGRGLMQAPSITTADSVSALTKRRSPNSSFMTDGEFSTFSEDDDEDSAIMTLTSVGIPLRRSAESIFRPISGTKRPHRFLMHSFSEDDMDIGQKDAFSLKEASTSSTPMVCRANPIRGDESEDESFTLSNKRMRRSPSSAEVLNNAQVSTNVLAPPQYLHHPLSFESWSKAHCTGLATEHE